MAVKKLKNWWWLAALIAFVVVNYISSFFHMRLDLTEENRFSISDPVKELLGKLDDDVQVLVFLNGDLPSGFRKLSTTTRETLREFNEYSHGRFSYTIQSADEKVPGTDISYADSLASLGIHPINLTVQLKEGEQSRYVYPAAIMKYQGRWQPVELYAGAKTLISPAELNSAEALLEYKLANALQKLTTGQKPLIAYSTGNGEPVGINTYDLVENVLKKDYQLFTFQLNGEPVIPDTFRALLIVKPTITFTEQEKLKIDQYIMRGGKVLFFIDRLESEMDSLQMKNQVIAYDRNLELNDIFFRYGARINPDLLMDLQCDYLPFNVNNQDQFEFLHWNYFPLFESRQNHSINKNLGLVAGKFVNTIDTVSAPDVQKTILLSSSDNARSISSPALISGEENRNAPVDATFSQKNLAAAVLLEGKFTSLFKNRISTAQLDTLDQYGTPFLASGKESKIIIVADGDIALNATFQGNPLPMGVNPYTVGSRYEYQFANRRFVENCLEYLTDNSGLNVAKSKDYQLRLLDPKKVNEERGFWQIINIAAPVVFILIFGLIFQYVRKKKYVYTGNESRNK